MDIQVIYNTNNVILIDNIIDYKFDYIYLSNDPYFFEINKLKRFIGFNFDINVLKNGNERLIERFMEPLSYNNFFMLKIYGEMYFSCLVCCKSYRNHNDEECFFISFLHYKHIVRML